MEPRLDPNTIKPGTLLRVKRDHKGLDRGDILEYVGAGRYRDSSPDESKGKAISTKRIYEAGTGAYGAGHVSFNLWNTELVDPRTPEWE